MKGKHFKKREDRGATFDNEVAHYSHRQLVYLLVFFLLAVISLIWCYIETSSPWIT